MSDIEKIKKASYEKVLIELITEEAQKEIDKQIINKAYGNVPPEKTIRHGNFIVKKVIEREIDHCWQCCPYFESHPMDPMECTHPYFKDEDIYDRLIIGWDEDIKNGFPSKCPLFINDKE